MNLYERTERAMVVRRTFSFDEERDAALLTWLDAQVNASEAVRAALRAYRRETDTVTLERVYQAVKALEAQVRSGQWVRAAEGVADTKEDPELAAQLDQLGL